MEDDSLQKGNNQSNTMFVGLISVVLLFFTIFGIYVLKVRKSNYFIQNTNTNMVTPLLSLSQQPTSILIGSPTTVPSERKVSCGGPRAIQHNAGCPAGYHCGDMKTVGGETSGTCIKNYTTSIKELIFTPTYSIIDGSVYQILESGEKKLFIDKRDYQDNEYAMDRNDPFFISNYKGKYNDYFKFNSIAVSPDKSKIIVMAGETSVQVMYFTPASVPHLKYLGFAVESSWSHNSRYIAYTSKHADAGAVTDFIVYDTILDKEVPSRPFIKGLTYDFLGFGAFQWLDDDSGVKVHYTAYQRRDNDPDPMIAAYGAVVGEGEEIILLNQK